MEEDPTEPKWNKTRHFVIEKGNLEYALMYLGGGGYMAGSMTGKKKRDKKGNEEDLSRKLRRATKRL